MPSPTLPAILAMSLLLCGCAPAHSYSPLQANSAGTVHILSAAESHDLANLEEAKKVAEAWFTALSQDRIEEAWQHSASFMRATQPGARAIPKLRANRQRLGPLRNRRSLGANLMRDLPGTPAGDYAVLQYSARYSTQRDFLETLTLAKEQGEWKVAGYFMK